MEEVDKSYEEEVNNLKRKYKLKEMELNALLEITQAINDNLSEENLFKIYNFSLRANLNINKLAMFVFDEIWICKVAFGLDDSFRRTRLDPLFLDLKTNTLISDLNVTDKFKGFDLVIPVSHKDRLLALVFVDEVDEGEQETNITFIHALSNLIIVAVENKKLARKELRQEAFRKELEIAKDVQNFLFPNELPYGIRLKIEASYLPHHTIGGDYYDYIPINQNQFLICVADVSGKGVPAAILMSNFQASLRTLVRQTPNLTEIIEELNFQILENAKGENFITFFVAIYDHSLNTMVYVNSGHNPPILADGKNGLQFLESGSTVLGMFHPLPFINEGFITDLNEFLLLLYTDGLTETFNDQEEEYGVDRLKSFVDKHRQEDLKVMHKNLLDEIDGFKGNNRYHDDLTAVSCRVEP
ncbi:MAG: PP2C family protein-serine/threonine phosphatase [Bacteroidota bacterium]